MWKTRATCVKKCGVIYRGCVTKRLSCEISRRSKIGSPRLRNRTAALVGFRIDNRSRLVGEAWVSKSGLTTEEFELYVRNLAAECDRFEFVLTGRDAE